MLDATVKDYQADLLALIDLVSYVIPVHNADEIGDEYLYIGYLLVKCFTYKYLQS